MIAKQTIVAQAMHSIEYAGTKTIRSEESFTQAFYHASADQLHQFLNLPDMIRETGLGTN
jgi:hypothetical protein